MPYASEDLKAGRFTGMLIQYSLITTLFQILYFDTLSVWLKWADHWSGFYEEQHLEWKTYIWREKFTSYWCYWYRGVVVICWLTDVCNCKDELKTRTKQSFVWLEKLYQPLMYDPNFVGAFMSWCCKLQDDNQIPVYGFGDATCKGTGVFPFYPDRYCHMPGVLSPSSDAFAGLVMDLKTYCFNTLPLFLLFG